MHIDVLANHSLTEAKPVDYESYEWCEKAFSKLIKLSLLLKGLDLINGRLVNVRDKHVVNDQLLLQHMHTFKSISTIYVRYHSLQNTLSTSNTGTSFMCVNRPIYTEHVAMDSLKKVCDFLAVSAQQRKLVRLAICTQIVVNCLRFLDDVEYYEPDSTSWMRVAPKKDADSSPNAKWYDLLEMFNDLINCLKNDHEFFVYVVKLETMKEGLSQILMFWLIRILDTRGSTPANIRDIELGICCWFYEDVSGNNFFICVGKILTSDNENMIRHAVEQLDKALRVIKFVNERGFGVSGSYIVPWVEKQIAYLQRTQLLHSWN
ncbi:uncharacterized protein [Rutidosis leptorrhynchoides]|uniref:uncharacterized protein n=1 Tax=Rutidosis leptorrhynchoides TaxID=125765 RepID=UPI003A98CF35